MQTMQDKITEHFRALIEDDLKLDMTQSAGRGSNVGTWYVQRGLDTLLGISYDFQSRCFSLTLSGPAVTASSTARRSYYVEYVNGNETRETLDAVCGLLTPPVRRAPRSAR